MNLLMKRALLIATIAVSATLWATTVIPMSVEKLAAGSTHIVEARAVKSSSQWNADHTLIFTYTEFTVTRTLKGQLPATILVRQLGGTVEGITQKVAGVRHWRPGEEAVLFLQPSSIPDGAMVVTGLMQGNFLMRRTASGVTYVSNGMPEASEYHISSGQATTSRGKTMGLDELESRIQKAVRK